MSDREPLLSDVRTCWCGHGSNVHISRGDFDEGDAFECDECDCPDFAPLVPGTIFAKPAPVGMYEQRGPR